ncbi:hypothetical protein BH10ACT4_BH10ACT4_14260 [soil metagenome]
MSTAVMSTARYSSSARFSGPTRITAQRTDGAPRTAAPTSRLRITRRGYALLTLVVAAPLVIAAVGFAVNGGGAAAGADASSVVFEHVTVQPGESLWQLAGEIAPSSDPRDVVSDIVQLNQLNSAEVQPGQSLAVPLKYSH